MDLGLRLVIVVALAAVGALLTIWYRHRVAADAGRGATDAATGASLWPDLPSELLAGEGSGAVPTWVIFSTPLCVSCTQVQADLERRFPDHRVTKIDATVQPDLADRYDVRRAPTTVLADPTGRVRHRLVGPEAVRDLLANTAAGSLL